MDLINPFGAVADLIVGIYKTRKIQDWISLVFQLHLSAVVGFLSTCGVALVNHKGWEVSIGSGMIVASAAMFTVFVRSKLTKGMLIVAPEDITKAEQTAGLKEIQK